MNKFGIWLVIFCVTSVVIFLGSCFLFPGFPFFPKRIFQTKQDISRVRVGKGTYHILYFIEGEKKVAVSRPAVGPIKITLLKTNADEEVIPIFEESYFFDSAPNSYGTRGHAVGGICIQTDCEIEIKSTFRKAGYDGLIIRTDFKKMLVSVALFEVLALALSGFLMFTFLRFNLTRKP